jgi:hypothetical protein
MRITLQTHRTYIPAINGNRDLPPGERITVTYRQPNAIERREYKASKVAPGSDGKGEVSVQLDIEKILGNQDVGIEHLEVETSEGKSSKVVPITKGYDLARNPSKFCTKLAEEVATEIMDLDFSDELLKNFSSASVPTSKDTPKSDHPSGTDSR